MAHQRLKSIFLTSVAVSVLMTTDATALQDQAGDQEEFAIEEIVVTARRRSESLIDVPGTVTAITSRVIENANIQRAEDFIGLTPGVTIVDAAEVGDTQVNIRGINGARDAENSFAFIIDGILHTNPAAFNREFTNLQQIEIFKGPQGAIYGRNAAAGAIIITTRDPSEELQVSGKASFANNDSVYASAAIEGPLAGENLRFLLSGDYRDTDGFYRNSFQDNAPIVDNFESYNVDGRLLWEPNEALEVDLRAHYGEVDASAITFNATFNLPNFAAAFGNPAADEDVNDHQFVFQPNIISNNDQETFELSAKFDYDMDWASLTGWVLYSDIDSNFIADGTSAAFGFFNADETCRTSTADLNAAGVVLPPPQILGQVPDGIIFTPDFSGSFFGPYTPTTCDGLQEQLRKQEDISFEFRLASPDDQALRWMGGVYFLDIERETGVSLARDSGMTPIRGLVQTSGPNRTEALVYDAFDSQVFAVFGQLEFDLTDDIELSAALRYDREERKVSNLVPTDVLSTVIDLDGNGIFDDPLNPGLSQAVNPSGIIPDQKRTFEQVQPKISATWDATDELTLFASWGVGFKAGGFNNQGSAATIDIFINGFTAPFLDTLDLPPVTIEDVYDKETSSSFEAGIKGRLLDGRLQFEGAGFYTKVDDMQFFEFFVGPFGLLRVVSNLDDVTIYGFELGANAQVHEYLNLYGSIAVTDSEIKNNTSRPDTVGNKSPYTPDYTINAGAEFSIPIADGINFLTRLDAQVIGPTWFHTVQDQQRPTIFSAFFEIAPVTGPGSGPLGFTDFSNTRRSTYHTIDLRAGFQGENWSLMGFAKNLTKNAYLEEVIAAPEFGGTFIHPGPLRTVGVEASFRF
ncbi:MAG: TonB-dependent receptor [Sphingomonadales bacterium]